MEIRISRIPLRQVNDLIMTGLYGTLPSPRPQFTCWQSFHQLINILYRNCDAFLIISLSYRFADTQNVRTAEALGSAPPAIQLAEGEMKEPLKKANKDKDNVCLSAGCIHTGGWPLLLFGSI